MIGGVNHVGIGVSDIGRSLTFYRDVLGFKEVYDYTGVLPGIDHVLGEAGVKVRVVMLKSENVGPLGLGLVKLVQILPPHKAGPLDIKYVWGDVGIAEVALHVKNIEEIYDKIVRKGFKAVLPPVSSIFDGEEVKFSYLRDPDGSLVELVEWAMYKGFGGAQRIEGVNHVAFGVTDIEKSIAFYRDNLGFKEAVFDFTGYSTAMAPMFPELIKMRIILLTNEYREAWIEIVQHLSPHKSKPKPPSARWGHIGPMEFAISVSNIEKVYEELRKKGIQFNCPLQTVHFPPSGEWKYAYMADPDDICVSIVEH